MAKSAPILFGKTDEMIFQIICRAAIPLSTHDVYQRLLTEGTFHEVPAQKARADIAAKLRKLKSRGVIGRVDPIKGNQLWQLDPDTREKLPRVTDASAPLSTGSVPVELPQETSVPKAKVKPKIKTAPATILSMVKVDMPVNQAEVWADALNDLTYQQAIDPRVRDMFSAIESTIRRALPQEAA
jgi:hypothetical protein